MTEKSYNQRIHEGLGRCWHDWSVGHRVFTAEPYRECLKCGEEDYRSSISPHPDYFTPWGFFEIFFSPTAFDFVALLCYNGNFNMSAMGYKEDNPNSLPRLFVKWLKEGGK